MSLSKNQYVGVRLSENEYQTLKRKAEIDSASKTKKGQINISKYIRKQILESETDLICTRKQMDDLIYQIRKIGVNVNQVTKKINADQGSLRDVRELQEALVAIENQLKEFVRCCVKEGEENGNHETTSY